MKTAIPAFWEWRVFTLSIVVNLRYHILQKLTYLDNELGEGVCSDPAVVEAYANDPMVEKKISVGLINQFGPGIAWLKENAANFTDPVLVLHGNEDRLVAEKDSRDFYGDISTKDKTLKIYALLMHEIFNEPSKEKIYGEVVEWIEERL